MDASALDALRPLVRLLAHAAAREALEAAGSRPSEVPADERPAEVKDRDDG